MLDVPDIELDPLLPGKARAAVDLGPAGDARLDVEPAALAVVVALDLVGERRPRADHAHLAPQHVPELRELVERQAAQDAPHARDARIPLVDGQPGSLALGADDHGAQLDELELLSASPHAPLAVERRASILELDRCCRGGEEGARRREESRSEQDVEGALHLDPRAARTSSYTRSCASAAASQVRALRARPVPSKAAASSSFSVRSRMHAAASAPGSSGGTTSPAPNSRTVSPSEPTSATTAGRPCPSAVASTPEDSIFRYGRTTAVASSMSAGISCSWT